MVDISGKIAQIRKLIDNQCYFTINRARQYGKTTTLTMLKRTLIDNYITAKISFEGLGDESFESAEAFCQIFLELVHRALRFSSAEKEYTDKWLNDNVKTFPQLSQHITKMCADKKVVLMIDEVDKTSNNRVYLHFLGILRNKFLSRQEGADATFQSVILAGVYDVRNIKLKMIEEGAYTPAATENKIFNSPWNIAVNFEVDMSFNPTEIATMLTEYENDHKTGMSVKTISIEIHNYTSGYPFLVSRICQIIDEKLDRDWTVKGVQNAVQILLFEKNTLFDDLFKNLENNKELSEYLYNLLILNGSRSYITFNSTVLIGDRYGYIKNVNGQAAVSNRIFELLMTDYYIEKDLCEKKKVNNVEQYDIVNDNKFNMELCLRKFAEHYAEIFNDNDLEFFERHGRLLFLSYLKPLINGLGFYHIESQFTDSRRMDIVVDFAKQQFIIELKLWRGKQYQADSYKQLCGYLDSKGTDTGYLLTFNFRKETKIHKAEWIEIDGKKIFDVMV
jgi:hypothetical protein